MFSHPASIFGYVLIGVGFALLMVSDHLLLMLSIALESIGFFLILLGVIAQGFDRICRYLDGVPQMKAAYEASAAPTYLLNPPANGGGITAPRTDKDLDTRKFELQKALQERGLK